MTTLMELPVVSECTVTGCSYNHNDGCHAGAITVGASGSDAVCTTFIPLGVKGGLEKVAAHVGACQRTDCMHNAALECRAGAVQVGDGRDVADCLTYRPRGAEPPP